MFFNRKNWLRQSNIDWLPHLLSEWFSLRLLEYLDLVDMAKLDSAICNHEYRHYWHHCLLMKAITSKLSFSIDYREIELLEKVTEWCFYRNIDLEDLTSITYQPQEIKEFKRIRLTFMRTMMKYLRRKRIRDKEIKMHHTYIFNYILIFIYIVFTVLMFYLRCVLQVSQTLCCFTYFVIIYIFTTFRILKHSDDLRLCGITLFLGPAGMIYLIHVIIAAYSLHFIQQDFTLENILIYRELVFERFRQGNVPKIIEFYYKYDFMRSTSSSSSSSAVVVSNVTKAAVKLLTKSK